MRGRGPINSAIGRKDEVLAPARDQTKRAFREARRSGFLSMPARNLTEFPPEIYHLEEHLHKDEKKWECVDLVKIDLSHNTISSISDEIAGLSTVSSIKLCQNALKTLPKGFFELVNLTYLDLSNNQLQSVSESLGALRNLKELGLASNKLQTLPQSIAHLCNLELLRIEENVLSVLPESIGHLQRLHTLILHTNQLTTLPTSFGNLRNLQTLDMKKNRVDTMAGQLATLQSLKFLDLRQNKLVVFPQLPQSQVMDQVFLGFNVLSTIDEVSILRAKDSITVLDLRDNKLSILPTNIACLYKLKTLDVTNNDLVDLPPGLGYLKHLNHLVVDGNPLRAIRRAVSSASCESLKKYLRTRGGPPSGVDVLEEEVDELQLHRERERAMKAAASGEAPPSRLNRGADITSSAVYRDAASSGTLDLASHVLQSIPSEVCGGGAFHFSTTLVHLNLSKNRLTQLPSEIGELSSLVSLTVEDNQLREIDPSIAFLSRLQLVRIRKNQLTTDAINSFLTDDPQLISLKELDLRNNSLAHAPSNLRYLTSMETLLLSFNKIETLEEFPWYELINTSVLSISDNKLKSLGQVYLLPRLASISIENNTLSSIPCELGLCPDLRAIYINGNPQKTVRGGVIAKGSMEIITYLKNKLPPNARLKPAPIPPTPQSQPSMQSSTLVAPRTPGVSVKRLEMYASTSSTNCIDGEDTEGENTRRSMPTRAIGSMKNRSGIVNTSRQTQNNDDDESSSIKDNSQPQELDEQIMNMEEQLENHALSAPKRYALKKELAVLRSTRIRQGRHKYAPNE